MLLIFKTTIRQNYSGKLVKATPQSGSRSYFPKFFPRLSLQNECLKAAVFQTCSPKRFPKIIL